ncbi:MAG: hypothetical protein ACTSR8_04675 [Promethearchaeota archaeon]
MKDKNTFDSNYRYNPLNPLNWSIFCKVTFILSILLIIDWIIGISIDLDLIEKSYLASTFSGINLLSLILPIIIFSLILVMTPFLNDEMEGKPFYGAILIQVMLELGGSNFTVLGTISQNILDLCCIVFIVTVLVFVIFFETEDASYYIQAFSIAIILLVAHFLFNLAFNNFRCNEIWAIIVISISSLGLFLVKKEQLIFGSLSIIVIIIINDYVVPFGLSGFNVGTEILKFGCALLFIKGLGDR